MLRLVKIVFYVLRQDCASRSTRASAYQDCASRSTRASAYQDCVSRSTRASAYQDCASRSKLFFTWLWLWFMVFNALFNNISVISWWSVLMVGATGVPRENHRPVASH